MIRHLYEVKCDGCGVGCGGIFDDVARLRELLKRLNWVERDSSVPEVAIHEGDRPRNDLMPAQAHFCSGCSRGWWRRG